MAVSGRRSGGYRRSNTPAWRSYVRSQDGVAALRQSAEEHQRLAWIGEMEMAVILDSAVTGGQLSVVEIRAKRGDASPVHVHSRDDEAFFVLDGTMTVWVGEQRRELGPGSIGFLPREIPHSFRFDTDARALTLTTPAGQEGFFRSVGWDLSKPRPQGWSISWLGFKRRRVRCQGALVGGGGVRRRSGSGGRPWAPARGGQ